MQKKNIDRRTFLELSALTTVGSTVGSYLLQDSPPALAATHEASHSQRVDTLINQGWKFFEGDVSGAQDPTFSDSAWLDVTLPHTWNNIDGENGGNYYRGISWYRLHLTVPAKAAGQRLFLQFDGAALVADVFVNGTLLGQHQGGFATFRFDATAALMVGQDNIIAVKVDNARSTNIPPFNGDFSVFGGLYRDVHLVITHPVHMQMLDFGSSGLFLRQTNVSTASANLQVTAGIRNDSATPQQVTLLTTIVNAKNKVVQTLSSTQNVAANSDMAFVQNTTIMSPHLWDGQRDPYLYQVHAQVQIGKGKKKEDEDEKGEDEKKTVDMVTAPLGFRFFHVDPNNGFFLNGQYLDLHGVNVHQDHIDQGWAIGNAQHDQDFKLMTEMGVNAIRTSHYQHAPRFYENADTQGIVVWSEQPLINGILTTPEFTQSALQQMTEMIRQNYNHPSIIFWSIANEVGNDPATNALLQSLHDLTHAQDPDRPTTLATNGGPSDALANRTDVVGYNRYFGWYVTGFNDLEGFLTSTHQDFPTRSFAMSEYGAGASIIQHQDVQVQPVPASHFHPEEWQTLSHEIYWQAMATKPYIWGKFIWVMFDFASAGRDEGDHAGRNDKGVCTYDRQTPKDAYFWYKANWTTTPFVHITGRRFTNRTTPTIDIKVYANTSTVSLKINGVSLGEKTSTNHIFLWPGVALQMGDNTVHAITRQDGKTHHDMVVWNRA